MLLVESRSREAPSAFTCMHVYQHVLAGFVGLGLAIGFESETHPKSRISDKICERLVSNALNHTCLKGDRLEVPSTSEKRKPVGRPARLGHRPSGSEG